MLKTESGAIAVYAAVTIPLFVGGAGLAVDATSWYRAKRNMQSGADAAAYAAAINLARQGLSGTPDLTAVQAAADDAAGRNGVADPVEIHTPPSSGIAMGDAQSVEVIVTEPAPIYFTSMFLGSVPQITARAVAKAVVADGCIWSLDPSAKGALTISGSANVDLDCGVVVNSNHPEAALDQSGTSCLSATSISVGGGYDGNCVSPEPEVHTPNYGDPLSSLVEPSFGGCDHTSKVSVSSGASATLMPGVYCKGISLNGDVVLDPGLYVLNGDGLDIQSSAIVTNNENASGGVTLYLTGSGSKYASVNVSSGSQVTLTPMTTGTLENVLFFQDRNAKNGQSKLTGQSQMHLTGILYFPNSEVEFTGGSAMDEAEVLLVALTLKITGNSYLNADYANNVLPQQEYARLVE